jgi:ankyrin repeat protein
MSYAESLTARRNAATLWLAASKGRKTKVRQLLAEGVDVNNKNGLHEDSGYTALGIAAHCGHIKVMRILLDANADTEVCSTSKDWTLLHWACFRNELNVVELLLEYNANVDARDYQGRTPLHYTVRVGRTDTRVLELLIRHRAYIPAKSVRGLTALDEARQTGCSYHVQVLEEEMRKRSEAFAMGLHERLGAGTSVAKIEEEVLRMILAQMQ